MSEPEPEQVHTSSQPIDGSKPHILYKSLLNQYAQKLRKPLPFYQTPNEGLPHQPKFRSTVWFDDVSYTSANTFQQRKMAESDVSKVAFFAILQKIKNEASDLVHKNKAICKSILVEYATRMGIEKPTYQTTQLEATVPVFRSFVVFNGVTYTGDIGKSKKEAEQVVARAVILKYLDSTSGNIMSEIINSKSRQYAEMLKVHEAYNIQNVTNARVETGFNNVTSLNTTKADSGVTQPPISQVSTQSTTPANPSPATLAQTFAGIYNLPASSAISAPCLGQYTNIPATHLTSNVPVDPPLALASTALEQMPFVCLTSKKKRKRNNKKNARKKMIVDAQSPIPAIPASQAPACSAQ